jgi:hypothetical protein
VGKSALTKAMAGFLFEGRLSRFDGAELGGPEFLSRLDSQVATIESAGETKRLSPAPPPQDLIAFSKNRR